MKEIWDIPWQHGREAGEEAENPRILQFEIQGDMIGLS